VNLSCQNFFGPGYERGLALSLLSIIDGRRPASVIRLGDGEGNILAIGSTEFPTVYAFAIRRIMSLMFGRTNFTVDQMEGLRVGMERAISEADVIGVPSKQRIMTCYRGAEALTFGERVDSIDVRGVVGSLDAVRLAHRALMKAGRALNVLTDCYVHRDLLPFYAKLLRKLPFVGVISCYGDLGPAIFNSFGVKAVQVYAIPPQAVNIGGQPDCEHYPGRFHELMSSLQVPVEGTVFLVAAGIVGKLYCARIKELGGIAIDIGSVADVWMGQRSRPYHSLEYLQKWQLVSGAGC
jgi:hypothetical protein